jgi:hypothetical protein
MSRQSGRQRSTGRNVAGERNAFYQPKQLTILSIWFFVTAIYAARTVAAVQRAGLVETGLNQFGNFHFHHWSIFFLVLPALLVFAFAFRDGMNVGKVNVLIGKEIWGISILGIAVCLGLFVDGIVYMDSAIFFEANTEVRQPLSMEDLYFQLLLGVIWFVSSIVLFVLMGSAYRNSNPQRRR